MIVELFLFRHMSHSQKHSCDQYLYRDYSSWAMNAHEISFKRHIQQWPKISETPLSTIITATTDGALAIITYSISFNNEIRRMQENAKENDF